MKFFKKNKQLHISKNVHILTLDNKWHELFQNTKSAKMQELEKKLNGLLQKQGKYNTEYKEYTQLKKKLMDEIIGNMTESNEKNANMEKNKTYINEINKKLEKMESELGKLPQQINEANEKLLNVGMAVCYERMQKRKRILNGMDEKIDKLREELKELVVLKTESKEEYDKLYVYMHDLVGSEVIEAYDSLYMNMREKSND